MVSTETVLHVTCLLVIATYVGLIDLKGITTDEGIRLAIINGGAAFGFHEPSPHASWSEVLKTISPYAYQPLYYLMQNTLMSVAQTHNVIFFRLVNIFFLWVSLQGLLALSKQWQLVPRLFLIGLFSFNAYLFMHVLQIREYIVAVTFYIWSSWLVLQLDNRTLGRPWADSGWFTAYGLLLGVGFFTQTWVVFPAIGQFLFLITRPRVDRWRFFSHLALSYLVVLSASWTYLQTNRQKADVGRWGVESSALWPQLSDGFHLAIAGHHDGHSLFTDLLFWFWILLVVGAASLMWNRRFRVDGEVAPQDFKRQGYLMALCIAVSLSFQIGYFYKVENLSVWPRYFVVHYFFLVWLIAMAFHFFYTARKSSNLANWERRGLNALTMITLVVLLGSGAYQTRSYFQDPYLDTGLSRAYTWQTLSDGISAIARAHDAVIFHDFVIRSTVTFSQPIPNAAVLLDDLEKLDLHAIDRFIYLESSSVEVNRSGLAERLSALGFHALHEVTIPADDGQSALREWQLLVFSRQ